MDMRLALGHVTLGSLVAMFLMAKCTGTTLQNSLMWSISGAIIIYTGFWTWLYPFYLSPLRSIPTVPGFPLWGHFMQIIANEVGVPQRQWHEEYGPIVRYFLLLGCEHLSIADDDALKQVTQRNAYNYRKPLYIKFWLKRVFGEGVLLAEGQEHAKQRKILSPAFSSQSIKRLSGCFWNKGIHLAEIIQKQLLNVPPTGSFELLGLLSRTTLDIIGLAAFGTNFNSLDYPESPVLEAYENCLAFDAISRLMQLSLALVPPTTYILSRTSSIMQSSEKIVKEEADRILVSKYYQTLQHSTDILSLLLHENERPSTEYSEKLSFITMRDQIMTFVGAGHDTTANAAAWTLYLLAKHASVQTRLRTEIFERIPELFDPRHRSAVVERAEDFDVDHLPYLNNVCRESLRCIPPVPVLVRESRGADVLGGHVIPKSTTVCIYPNTINRLPRYWGETADDFIPERWDSLPSTYTRYGFMTFLYGPRGCIGRKFAETEMKCILCALLSAFEFSVPPNVKSPERMKKWTPIHRPQDGILLDVKELSRRNSSDSL